MAHDFNCLATGIGSLPLTDPDAAVALALRYLPEAPIWPQLPRRGFREHMGGQYSEGLPGLVADEMRERFWIDTARDLSGEFERFYERYLAKDYAYFAISEDHAAGLHALLRALAAGLPPGTRFLKGHVTGPLTAGISFKDARGRDVIHDEALFDAVVKNLAMKAAWQVELLGRFGRPVIVFIDEPALETLGSAFSAASPELVAEKIDEIVDAIHEHGGIAGIHCCGNADWSLVLGTRTDIVNFDAHDYLERVLLYPGQVRAFVERGGALAWGIVPTTRFTGAETAAELVARVEAGLGRLAEHGLPRATVLRRSIVTPACGLGSLGAAQAEAILKLTLEVSGALRRTIPA
jgi:hypothetical protein